MEYKANNHLLVSGDSKLSLSLRSEGICYFSSTSLRKDSYIQIMSEVIVCPITNGNYLPTITSPEVIKKIAKLSLSLRSEGICYFSSTSLRKDSYIQITSEVIVCPITNGNYLPTITSLEVIKKRAT